METKSLIFQFISSLAWPMAYIVYKRTNSIPVSTAPFFISPFYPISCAKIIGGL